MLSYLTICVATVLVYSSSVSAVCEGDLSSQVKNCLFKSKLFETNNLAKDAEELEKFCVTDRQTLLSCIRTAQNECKDDVKQMRLLKLILNLDSFEGGLNAFCNNRTIITNNLQCVATLDQADYVTCLNDAIGELANAGKPTDLGESLEFLCKFFDSNLNCMGSVFSEDCSDVKKLFTDLLISVKYPYCKKNAVEKKAALAELELPIIGGSSSVVCSFITLFSAVTVVALQQY